MKMIKIIDDWEFNVLGIYNFRKPGPFSSLFDFVRENHHRIEGDLVEAGVFRGSSLLAMALMLKEIGSSKKVYGFDSFEGFPPVYHPNDDLRMFQEMYRTGRITKDHADAVGRNIAWREAISGATPTVANISTSGSFSETGISLILKKIEILKLDNVVLVDGKYSDSMTAACVKPERIMAVLMDCDLYASYMQVFDFVWPRLSPGSMIYLDEYYSLKFPGARIATDEFIAGKSAQLKKSPPTVGDFERWHIIKD